MNDPVKLTYMIDWFASDVAGGTEVQLINMINGLNEKGFEITLICLRSGNWEKLDTDMVSCTTKMMEINKFKRPVTYLNYLKLISHFRKNRPDVVHTFFPTSNVIGVLAARLAGVKAIVSSRRDYGEWMNTKYLIATKFANRFVDKVISNSHPVKYLTVGKEKLSESKVDVIFNGIDVSRFDSLKVDLDLKESLGIPRNDKVVAILANFRPMKYHWTFVRAAKIILDKRPDVSFLLIGEGPTMADTQKLADELGVANKMFFAGSRGDVIDLLPIIDVGVNCSEAEGLSNAIMEYMCAGVPCVVSDGGGNTDLIHNGVNGYTFDLDDHDALAHLTLEVLGDDELCHRFIEESKKFILENMTLDIVVSKYEETYKNLIQK